MLFFFLQVHFHHKTVTNGQNCNWSGFYHFVYFLFSWHCGKNVMKMWQRKKIYSEGKSHFHHNLVSMSWQLTFMKIQFVTKMWWENVLLYITTFSWKSDKNVKGHFLSSFFGPLNLKIPAMQKVDDHSQWPWRMIRVLAANESPMSKSDALLISSLMQRLARNLKSEEMLNDVDEMW